MNDAARLMDGIYARQRHIYDATRKFYLLGRDRLIAHLDAQPGQRILEIGCGTGRNLVAIARRYPECQCYGLDISPAMLATARASLARERLESRVRLAQADATTFDAKTLFGVGAFDRVVVSYALSMIPGWEAVLREGVGVLAPGGSLHVVDFGDQAGLPKAFKTALETWLAHFHVAPRESLPRAIEELTREGGLTSSTQSLYRGYAIAACLMRMPQPSA